MAGSQRCDEIKRCWKWGWRQGDPEPVVHGDHSESAALPFVTADRSTLLCGKWEKEKGNGQLKDASETS